MPLLATRSGRLRGRSEGGLAVFKGIPFAAPPTGALRFAAPQPALAWQGEREAREFGPVPPQRSDPMIAALGLLGQQQISEDCLTLNVWTPGLDDGERPVMVWIHGGAFINGTGAAPIYDGARIAERGNVVVVTLNYRVGIWGFLHCEGLGPANRGLLDQIAALEWLRDHARGLGGDPAKVTVFGESAGAGSITSLLAMPRARGLFRRAIIQSAAPAGMIERAEASRRAAPLLERIGIAASDAAKLGAVEVAELLAAQAETAASGAWRNGMYFSPVIDGENLPAMPPLAIGHGVATGVDLLIGTTSDEMRLFLWGVDPSAVSESAVGGALAFELPGRRADGQAIADWARGRYEKLRRERAATTDAASLMMAVQTDTRLRLPSLRVAEAHAAHHPATFVYEFTQSSRMAALGACHALDLPFTFGSLSAPGMAEFAGDGAAERAVSDAMISAWTSFARHGDPSCEALGDWPRYAARDRMTMRIGPTPGIAADPFAAEREILSEIDFPQLPPAG